MSFILMLLKALMLIALTIAAFMALASTLGVDFPLAQDASTCARTAPRACLFMII